MRHALATFGLLLLMGTALMPRADAQNRGGGSSYRPPPAYTPPPPPSRPAQPYGYANPTYGGGSNNRGMQAPSRPYSPGSPAVRDAFRGPSGQPSMSSAKKPAATGFGSGVKDKVGSGSSAAGGSSGLRDKFGAAAGAAPGAARNASSGSAFGSSVKDQVGSGTRAAGATSGLRDKFNVAAGGDGKPPGGGSGAAAAAAGGPPAPGGPGESLKAKFNAAAGSGAGRIDGRQDPGPRLRPDPRGPFGTNAMQAEKEQGGIGAQRRGAALHESAARKARRAAQQKPQAAM